MGQYRQRHFGQCLTISAMVVCLIPLRGKELILFPRKEDYLFKKSVKI